MSTEPSSEFEASAVTSGQLTSWARVAAVASLVSFSLPTFITGVELATAMPPADAIIAILIGCLIIFAIGGVIGAIGAKTRLSSYLLTRIAFGDKGAGFVNVAFAISLLGWFGVNINLFSDAISGLSQTLFGASPPRALAAIIASLAITLTTYAGFKTINLLSSLMTPILALVTGLLFYKTLGENDLPTLMTRETAAVLSISDGIAAIVGAIIIGAIILPDITRFVRHWTGAIGVAFTAYPTVQAMVMVAAALAAVASGASNIIDILVSFGLGLGAFIIVIAGSWVLNTLNLYSTVLSVKATFPRLSTSLVVGGCGVIGTSIAFLELLDHFITFLTYLSILFVPVAGVLLADFIVVQPDAYQIQTLDHNAAVQPHAFSAWGLGSIIAFAEQSGSYSAISGIGSIDAILVAAVTHIVFAKLFTKAKGA